MSAALPDLSVVIPVCNEVDNVAPLAREVAAALRPRRSFELIFVDDGSTDGTAEAVQRVRAEVPEIRLLRHSRRSGQSAALHTGFRAARADWIATLDGDGQNDPADLSRLIEERDARIPREPALGLIIGHRITRRDSWLRRVSSRVANGVRARLLGDGTPDTGCGLKLMRRDLLLGLPCFDHMHRFLPALFRRQRCGSDFDAREPPAATAGAVGARSPQPSLGRHRRPLRRDVAERTSSCRCRRVRGMSAVCAPPGVESTQS